MPTRNIGMLSIIFAIILSVLMALLESPLNGLGWSLALVLAVFGIVLTIVGLREGDDART
jgi:VIT1/CCC1 family predicted Fe2+/Mn2+ transporter